MQLNDKKTVLVLDHTAYPEEYAKSLRLSPFCYMERLQRAIENCELVPDDCDMLDPDVMV
jgi:hypothetical protein